MSPCGSTSIRPITGRHLLSPQSSARSPIGTPCGSLSPKGGLRVYHVPHQYPSGLGRVSRPVTRGLRQRSAKPLHLVTSLLGQACQHLMRPFWLVEPHGPCNTSPGLTLPLAPGSRPPCDAGSRRFGSRLCDRLLREEATLSRRLRTSLTLGCPSQQRRTLR